MKRINTQSPAKINLYLRVLGKRHDGYHDIATSFQLIDLFDEMSFEVTKNGISVNSSQDFLNGEDNTIYKAAKRFKELFNIKTGIKININKNIPIGAGLGGGSSNAASTMVALNRLWDINLDTENLIDIAKDEGADVPLFIFGKNSIGRGIGEKLKSTDSIEDNLLLIQPDIHNSTQEMFIELDKSREENGFTINSNQNDFWDIYIKRDSIVRNFYKQNSSDYNLNLSGTGSCIYIRYNDKKELDKILKKIPSNWRFFFCKPLQYSPICYI